MEAREAIEVLTDKNTSIGTLKCDDTAWRKLKPAIDAAVSALEKQTPKSPVITPSCAECEKESCDGCLSDNYGFSVTLCPNCKEVVQNRDNGCAYTYNFCPDCGQALDWGENQKD